MDAVRPEGIEHVTKDELVDSVRHGEAISGVDLTALDLDGVDL